MASQTYREYLVDNLAYGKRGLADLCTYFLLCATNLVSLDGHCTLLTTNSIAKEMHAMLV
jgi:hypothetical protein